MDRLVALVPQLSALGARRRGELVARARIVEAQPGASLVREGEAGDAAYFVLAGRAVAGIPAHDGSYRALSAMTAGDLFGEIAALTGSRRTANVVADEATTLFEVPAAALRAVMDVPGISALVLGKLTERLARTTTADLPRLAGLDQGDLRELRQPAVTASVVPLPKTY
jgi:CRP-like cAMP-binding protein